MPTLNTMNWDHYIEPDAFGISRFQVLCCRKLSSVYKELDFQEQDTPEQNLAASIQSTGLSIRVFRGAVEIRTPETELYFQGKSFDSPESLIMKMQTELSNAV